MQLVRLNPTGRHMFFNANAAIDPAMAWRMAEEMARAREVEPFTYPLHQAPQPENEGNEQQMFMLRQMMRMHSDRKADPRAALQGLPAIRALNTWIELVRNRRGGTMVYHGVSF